MRLKKEKTIQKHPLVRRVYWGAYAILFYNAGLSFTTWLMQPESFTGGSEWLWVALFPPLLVGFFVVNHRLGCGAAECAARPAKTGNKGGSIEYPGRMPGV